MVAESVDTMASMMVVRMAAEMVDC